MVASRKFKMKKDYSILTQDDFNNHTHEELAKLQLDSIDKNISFLKRIYFITNMLIILSFILILINTYLFTLLFLIMFIICVKIKKRIEFKNSIRNVVYDFLKSNKLI
jgi:hypothetical protein